MEAHNFTMNVSASPNQVISTDLLDGVIAKWQRQLDRWNSPDSSVRHSDDGKRLVEELLNELRVLHKGSEPNGN